MRRIFAVLFLLAFVGAALAADNSVILTPGTGVTMRTKDVGGGVESPLNILGDTAGNALATVPGTPNASFALPIQGVTAGTDIPISIDQTTAGTTNGVVTKPATSGGLTTFFLQPTASDNHTNVKNGAGQVYWVLAENNSATVNYLRLYNAATGFNGCASATNLVTQIQIPANTAVGGVNIALPFGIPFSTGISICVTSGYATTDATNATATAMSLTIGYN